MIDLLARRNEIASQNAAAEQQAGSGWTARDLILQGRDKEPKLTDRPIVLLDNGTVYIVGPDVAPIQAALQAFIDRLGRAKRKAEEKGWEDPDLIGSGVRYQAEAVKHAKKALGQSGQITLASQEWNWVNSILGLAGVLVCSALAEVQSYDDV